jgi:hypothetical protein
MSNKNRLATIKIGKRGKYEGERGGTDRERQREEQRGDRQETFREIELGILKGEVSLYH